MEAFKETLEECQLVDIGFSGVWFTWEMGNLGVANEKWFKLFPLSILQHLPFSTSDHCPILLNTKKSLSSKRSGKFHFEAWWTMEEDLEKVIWNSWETNEGTLLEKLGKLQICLEEWSRKNRRHKEGLKRNLLKELEVLLEGERNDDTLAKIIDTKIHLNLEIDKDEMYCEQRARQNWLKLGDKNLAYFHICALARRQANTISKLVTGEKTVIEEESEILVEASSFFQNLFKSKGVADSCKVLEGIDRMITLEDNKFLLDHFRKEEIQTALEGMGPTKAPGDFGDFNNTYIVLIPKVPNPTQLVNFRPSSLCTVVYKVVAKAIANQLQNIIDKCINEVQSAFVPGRLITDNVLRNSAYD
ncbi:reverse transcriptase [Gossypium australe]|uniref:Reverse transcriptase n=1 Tax=Gossypium australe TaxID=47621 RepID=A0A5B6WQR3_9ROSI|nr:reverse transcriptase [Gossypium australe]